MCTIRISVINSNITTKSSLRNRQYFLGKVRSHRSAAKCCERCGNVDWIDNDGGGRQDLVAVTINEKGNAWVEKVTDGIPSLSRSIIFTI